MSKLLIVGPEVSIKAFGFIIEELKVRYDVSTSFVVGDEISPSELSSILEANSPSETNTLVVCDDRLLNYTRLSIIMALRSAGFKPIRFVSSKAVVDSGVEIGENTIVLGGAYLGAGTKIGFGCFIGSGAQIGAGSRIDSGSFIGNSCLLGNSVQVGMNSALDMGCIVKDGIKIGKFCYLGIPKRYETDISEKTFVHPKFMEPVRVYSFEGKG